MLLRLSNRLDRLAKVWVVLALLLGVILLSQLAVQPFSEQLAQMSGGSGLIDLKLSYTPEAVFGLIDTYGDEGRAAYRYFTATSDLVFPVAYGLFLSLLVSWLLKRGTRDGSRMRMLNLVPLGAWVFDWLENGFIVTMLTSYPDRSNGIAFLAAFSTAAKWAFSAATIIVLAIAVVLALRAKRNSA